VTGGDLLAMALAGGAAVTVGSAAVKASQWARDQEEDTSSEPVQGPSKEPTEGS
jgi:hypothetical protein